MKSGVSRRDAKSPRHGIFPYQPAMFEGASVWSVVLMWSKFARANFDHMSTTDQTDAPSNIAGWYGKMPCLGDFASRRLTPDFITPWDAWLQRSIATSRQQLGEQWLEIYLTS